MVGASSGGQMLAATLREIKVDRGLEICHIDDNKDLWGKTFYGNKVLSIGTKDITTVLSDFDAAFIGVGMHKLMKFRQEMFDVLYGRIKLLNIIHPTAHVSDAATIGEGNYIGAFSYVAPFAVVGHCNFFSADTVLEHHTVVGDLSSWGPSNSTSGFCVIGNRSCFGTNIRLIYRVSLGNDVIVSSGVLVCRKVADNKVVRFSEVPKVSVKDRRDKWLA